MTEPLDMKYRCLTLGLFGIGAAALAALLNGLIVQFLIPEDSPVRTSIWIFQNPNLQMLGSFVATVIIIVGNSVGPVVACYSFVANDYLRTCFVRFTFFWGAGLLLWLLFGHISEISIVAMALAAFGYLTMVEIFRLMAETMDQERIETSIRYSKRGLGILLYVYPLVVGASLFFPNFITKSHLFYAGWITKIATFLMLFEIFVLSLFFFVMFSRGKRFHWQFMRRGTE